jgi:hypothetical protein
MYTYLLRGLAKKACNQALEVFTPPEPLVCALADCGDNLRLFAMLLYKIGCYGNHAESLRTFRWDRFFDNLQHMSGDFRHVASWMSSTIDFVNGPYVSMKCFIQISTFKKVHILDVDKTALPTRGLFLTPPKAMARCYWQ